MRIESTSHPRIVRNHAAGARPNIAFHSGGMALPFFNWMMIGRETRAIDRASTVALLALSFWMAWTYPRYLVLMGGTFLGSNWYYRKRFGVRYPELE